MEIHRVTLGEGGRVVIPAALRKAMNIQPGDDLVLELEDGELRIFNRAIRQQLALKNLREIAAQQPKPACGSHVDDFIANRRKEWGEEG